MLSLLSCRLRNVLGAIRLFVVGDTDVLRPALPSEVYI